MNKEREILKAILHTVNNDMSMTFEEDMGGNTVTIIKDTMHTHCGVPDGSFDDLVNGLYRLLVKGSGLSWAKGGRHD